ncbi:MAG TPA: cytochrome c maturation protein CcmE [Acidobacteriaceae bacterium]|nr:cytochrome c maturation protein CcmE [Acidobacteriaceae bacterium]
MRASVSWKIVVAVVIVVGAVAWLSWTAVAENKEYYVTIGELNSMGNKAYSRHLRVAGNVEPGSIQRDGTNAHFVLLEQGRKLTVNYRGMEPPPDTFKDDAQALAVGTYGRDGVFHATELQAKCASKYAPAKPGEKPSQPVMTPASAPTAGNNNTAMLQQPAN